MIRAGIAGRVKDVRQQTEAADRLVKITAGGEIYMPRITAFKYEYMKQDARKLFKGKMAENDITQKKLADIVGISPPAFCIRFKSFDFEFEQLVKMIPAVGLSDEEILKLMKG